MIHFCIRIGLLLAFAASFAAGVFAANDAPGGFTTKAAHAVLMDAASGAVLYQKSADELAPPASMSKLMTLALLFKAMKEGKVKPSDEFTMSVNAWRKGGAPSRTSAMMVPVNSKARVDELIQGIIVQSGNDACISVAENIAGSEGAFAKQMTEEARRIGLAKSTFANATGLYDPNHLMTARELAILARHLINEYPEHYHVFGQKEFQYRTHKFFNRNPLLALPIGADGMKTGHIEQAGFGLVGSAVQEGKRLIVVVAGLSNQNERRDEAAKLLEWGFKSVGEFKLFDEGEIIGQARVWGGQRWYVPLTAKGEVTISLAKAQSNQRLSGELVYKAPLKPPVKKGDQVAVLKVSAASGAQLEIPLYATEDVIPAGIVRKGLDTLVLMALRRLAL